MGSYVHLRFKTELKSSSQRVYIGGTWNSFLLSFHLKLYLSIASLCKGHMVGTKHVWVKWQILSFCLPDCLKLPKLTPVISRTIFLINSQFMIQFIPFLIVKYDSVRPYWGKYNWLYNNQANLLIVATIGKIIGWKPKLPTRRKQASI